jgi:hypothetical protein
MSCTFLTAILFGVQMMLVFTVPAPVPAATVVGAAITVVGAAILVSRS